MADEDQPSVVAGATTRTAAVESGYFFGSLMVIDAGFRRAGRQACLCVCECGEHKVIATRSLVFGATRSCGCKQTNAMRAARLKTGARSRSGASPDLRKFYSAWVGMKERCSNPKHKDYKYYGALGVTVCERWQVFENFYADMWPRPKGKTLDRIDPRGSYEPNNCRWATPLEQRHNRRVQ